MTSKESGASQAPKTDGSGPSGDPSGPDAGDTTTWAAHATPPVILDDESGEGGEEEMETLVVGAPSVSRPVAAPSVPRSLSLERIAPSLGRGERVRLDPSAPRISLGRAEANDIRLYTDSASRQHASIEADGSGRWVLIPAPGKSLEIDGEATSTPVVLEVGMNLVLVRDHLRCVAEGIDEGATTVADGLGDSEGAWFRSLAVRVRDLRGVGRLIVLLLFGSGVLFYILSRG